MTYFDFNEPMSKKEKIEYLEEQEKHITTSKYVKLPYSGEVMAKKKREPRQESVSPLLKSFMDGSIRNDVRSDGRSQRVVSQIAINARNEVLNRLGIKR